MKNYDSAWDEGDENAWDEKYNDWSVRDWESWLLKSLSFPFEVKRVEDDREFIPQENNEEPFTIGHIFKVKSIELEDDLYGFIVEVKEGRRKGHVPLCDVEVASKSDPNYWPVKEYVAWFANR